MPVAMAISPDLRRLAVACRARDEVAFIDTDPRSATFHQVVKTTRVGNQPHALAWQPEGEALLVANFQGGSVSILDGASLNVRRTLRRFIHRPQRVDRLGARTRVVGERLEGARAFVEPGPVLLRKAPQPALTAQTFLCSPAQ